MSTDFHRYATVILRKRGTSWVPSKTACLKGDWARSHVILQTCLNWGHGKFPHDFPMISPWFPPWFPDHILQRWPSAIHGNHGRVTESPARMTHGNSGNTWKLEDSWMLLLLWYDNIILQLFMHMIFLLSHCTWYDILQCNVVNLLILLENIISPVNITNQLLLIWCSLYWKFTHNTEYHIYNIYIYSIL